MIKILFILLPSMRGKIKNVRRLLEMPGTVCRLLSALYLEKSTKKNLSYAMCILVVQMT